MLKNKWLRLLLLVSLLLVYLTSCETTKSEPLPDLGPEVMNGTATILLAMLPEYPEYPSNMNWSIDTTTGNYQLTQADVERLVDYIDSAELWGLYFEAIRSKIDSLGL